MANLLFNVICGGCEINGPFPPGDDNTLLEACHKGDFDAVCRQLEQGAKVNCANNHGSTPLILASLGGHFRTVDILLKYNANVNALGPRSWTALHAASYYGHVGIVCLLLSHGANTKIKNLDKKTPGGDFDPTVAPTVRVTIQKLIEDQEEKGRTFINDGLTNPQLEELLAALAINEEASVRGGRSDSETQSTKSQNTKFSHLWNKARAMGGTDSLDLKSAAAEVTTVDDTTMKNDDSSDTTQVGNKGRKIETSGSGGDDFTDIVGEDELEPVTRDTLPSVQPSKADSLSLSSEHTRRRTSSALVDALRKPSKKVVNVGTDLEKSPIKSPRPKGTSEHREKTVSMSSAQSSTRSKNCISPPASKYMVRSRDNSEDEAAPVTDLRQQQELSEPSLRGINESPLQTELNNKADESPGMDQSSRAVMREPLHRNSQDSPISMSPSSESSRDSKPKLLPIVSPKPKLKQSSMTDSGPEEKEESDTSSHKVLVLQNQAQTDFHKETISMGPLEVAQPLVSVVPQASRAVSQQGQWKDGPFDCSNNLFPSFCMSCWFPCVMTGQIRQKLKVGRFRDTIVSGLLWGYPCSNWYACQARGIIRQRHHIQGGELDDCLFVFCCTPCALSQMARQLYDYKTQNDGCICTKTGEAVVLPSQPPIFYSAEPVNVYRAQRF